MIGEASVVEQVAEKGKRRLFPAHKFAEDKRFMFEQTILPYVQRGNRDAKVFANLHNGCFPLEIGDQNG
jgi:hypothetical protein